MKNRIITFTDCLKTFTTDQDKAIRPEDTLKSFYEKVGRLDCVILNEVKRIDNGRLDIPVYFSICGEDAQALTGTKKQMGKGASPIQAEASACMELAERFSFFSFKNNPDNFLTGDYQSMRQAGYPVLDIGLLLKSVHDDHSGSALLESLLLDIPMRWTWATNITRGEEVLVPFSWFFAINEFNGPSAGNTYEEAALQGICEIVERHVSSLVNRERLATPIIDSESVKDPVAKDLLEKFHKHGIELYLNDFTLDTGICTVAALAIDRSTFPEKSEIVYTAGTTPNPEKALIRAVTEVAQLAGDFNTGSNYVASGLPKPLSMDEVAYLTDSPLRIRVEEMSDLSDNNIRIEIERCVAALENIDMEVLMIDVRHEQLDIPALYTIVPGAHFRERSMIQDVGLFSAKLVEELVHDAELKERKFKEMEKLLPEAYYLAFYRGRNALEAGDYEAALEHFDQALLRHPEAEDLPYIFSYKGSCLKELERYEEAIGVLRQGLDEDEERPDIHNLIGVCLFKLERYEEAISHFRRAVALNPASGIDYANLGVNHNRLGQHEEAIHFFTIALTLDPSLDFARAQLAELMQQRAKGAGKTD
jgi:ribosomal protein S12 methylthiotransferase accessory factor